MFWIWHQTGAASVLEIVSIRCHNLKVRVRVRCTLVSYPTPPLFVGVFLFCRDVIGVFLSFTDKVVTQWLTVDWKTPWVSVSFHMPIFFWMYTKFHQDRATSISNYLLRVSAFGQTSWLTWSNCAISFTDWLQFFYIEWKHK